MSLCGLGASAIPVAKASFLADPFLLLALGFLVAQIARRTARRTGQTSIEGRIRWGGALLVLAVTWGVSLSLYFNLEWVSWIPKLFGSKDGRDFMFNSGILDLPTEHVTGKTHLLAAAMFLTYPVWLVLGVWLGRKRTED